MPSVSKRRLGLIGVIGLAVLVAAVVAFRRPGGELPNLRSQLVTAAEQAGVGGTFHLAEVADFEWDRTHVFPPYTAELVSENLGFDWSPLSPAARLAFDGLYLGSEGLNLLVFVDGADSVTGWSLLGTQDLEHAYLELSPDGSPVVIERDADLLSVEVPALLPVDKAYRLVTPHWEQGTP